MEDSQAHLSFRNESCCIEDAAKLHSLRKKIQSRLTKQLATSKMQQDFATKLQTAQQRLTARQQNIPRVSFPQNLPISQKQQQIAELIQQHQVVILAGETGSGKTTQLPKICLSVGRGLRGMIGHTQPRRIAASTVASRIASELQVELGKAVGYQVRFNDVSNQDSYIKLMTDGILLAEIQQDPLLLKYDTLIIDEAHERSLNIDFLLGYLKQLLHKRKDLKIIVTSATIDLQKFSEHFDNAPIIEVSGRTYPVEVFYRPWQDSFDDPSDAIVDAIGEILQLSKGEGGDILVFLSGEREIRECSQAIKKAGFNHLQVLPLYARLNLAEQSRVFQTQRGRRIILATNVAETSITVPGIKFVIDPGTARISRYSVRTKVQRLPIEPISQASANQRMGRCGRVSDGICVRLYSEEDFNSRAEFTDAEILRTNLAAVILQMLNLKIGEVREFPFIDRPQNKLINDGYKLLEELQAVDRRGHITRVGRLLQKIPLDPRMARAMVDAQRYDCLNEMLIVVSALSLQDPRERPNEKRQAADEKHRRFWDEKSDFIAYVNLWRYVEEQRQQLSSSQFRKLCKKDYLNFMRLKEWRDLHRQLRLVCKDLKYAENKEPANYENLHRALLVGYVSNIGQKEEAAPKSRERDKDERGKNKTVYAGTRNKRFQIFPGSSQNKKRPQWLMAAEFIETSQLFCHCVAKIEADWVVACAEHLLKHHYYQPHYDAKSGQVKAYDRISLFGLILTDKRKVNFSDQDKKTAREVFIREALVEGGYEKTGQGQFFKLNRQLIQDVYELESKSRRRDILVDDEEIYRFYDERVPAEIVNLAGFEHWRSSQEKAQPELLKLDRNRLMLRSVNDVSEAQFPNVIHCDGLSLPLKYHFEPNHPDDGVSVMIPAELLHVIPANYLDWLVPGLLRDKCISLVKSLPKRLRKNFVPVPQFVDRALARLKACNRPLTDALAEALSHISGVSIVAKDWQEVEIEDFYRMNIQIVDERNLIIDRSRNLQLLQSKYKAQVQNTLKDAGNQIEKTGIKQWDFGELEREVYLNKGAVKVKGFPALVDKKQDVALEIKDNPLEASDESYRGYLRLAAFKLAQSKKYLHKQLLRGKDIGLAVVDMGSKEQVIDDIVLAAIARCCFTDQKIFIADETQFNASIESGRAELVECAFAYEKLLSDCLVKIVAIKKQMKQNKGMLSMAFTFGDIQQQLANLFFKSCLLNTPWQWLQQLPRYLQAIEIRLEKAPLNPRKDQLAIAQIESHWQRHQQLLSKLGHAHYRQHNAWQDYRWMMEEFRVSLFAQSLKTLMPVSDKRLSKLWQEQVAGH
ncbi:MAG: ATP-dependent RNA helicase HrpA [Cellvibrionaceae bacterium]|nr:ATP-dependent RNA helicase HrpA [Cellvibrionaceae bacterium]